MFEKILNHPNIRVMLNTDYFDVREELEKYGYEKLFYTGPIDRFFDFKHSLQERLEYRSINFVFETHDKEFY
jgi:UDP-galactopyranose mutase